MRSYELDVELEESVDEYVIAVFSRSADMYTFFAHPIYHEMSKKGRVILTKDIAQALVFINPISAKLYMYKLRQQFALSGGLNYEQKIGVTDLHVFRATL